MFLQQELGWGPWRDRVETVMNMSAPWDIAPCSLVEVD
jgi:hypothetical protein